MPLIIRRGVPADTDIVAEYNRAMALETEGLRLDPDTVARGVRAALGDESKALYFVAELDGRVVGQLMITREWSDWRNADIWWVQSVYVHPDHRGRGVLRALFARTESEARAAGVCALRLYVRDTNDGAKNCYQKLGLTLGHYLVMDKPL